MTHTIERLGQKGDGIAKGPVFVPRMLPGEVVTGQLNGDRLDDAKIVTPSDHRVKAPCPHYNRCGGCTLQHAHDDFVADWKQSVVVKALAAHGIEAAFRPIVTCDPMTRRRATFSGRRLKKGALVGFHTRASDTVVSIPNCHLLHPGLRAALPILEELTVLVGARKGEVSFAVTLGVEGLDVGITGSKPVDAVLIEALALVAQQHDLARVTVDGEPVVTRRPAAVTFDGIRVVPPSGAFLQATPEGEHALRAAVTEAVGNAKHIVDLFAGCGTFTLPLAKQAQLHAVEGEKPLTDALHLGWRQGSGLKSVTVETRDLFRRPLLPDELKRFKAIVIDPPRAGAEAQVAEIAKAQTDQIAFVSCNPTTFARDAKTLLDAGYRLNWVQVVDQFRWSAHIELAASFTAPHIAVK